MTSKTMPETIAVDAGLMWAKFDSGVEFDLHSGCDSMSTKGQARVTMGQDGTPARIVWEKE